MDRGTRNTENNEAVEDVESGVVFPFSCPFFLVPYVRVREICPALKPALSSLCDFCFEA